MYSSGLFLSIIKEGGIDVRFWEVISGAATVIDFIDLTMYAGELGLRMEELRVSKKASFANKKLMDSGIRQKYDIIVVAVKREGEEMIFNPKPDSMILPGDILIVLGDHGQISALEREV